jgi:hypothetical protein
MADPVHPITSENFIDSLNRHTSPNVKRLDVGVFPPDESCYLRIEVVNGSRAIFLALFMATVSILWCLAQFPEILRGMIFPRSVVNNLRVLISL